MKLPLSLALLIALLPLAFVGGCKKDTGDKSFFADRAWYISNPAGYSTPLPYIYGGDSVYYYNAQALGTWRFKDDSHVAVRAAFFGADSIEFELLDVRADFLKFRITKSTVHTQVNQVVECDTVP